MVDEIPRRETISWHRRPDLKGSPWELRVGSVTEIIDTHPWFVKRLAELGFPVVSREG